MAVIGGVLLAVQAPTNAILGKASGSPIVAAFISFLIGTIALGAVVAATSGKLFAPGLRQVPWYAWLGGFYGAFFVAVAAFGAPRVGVGVLLTAAVAGQLAAALVLDHYGLLGPRSPSGDLTRAAGFVLVLVGAVLVRRELGRIGIFLLRYEERIGNSASLELCRNACPRSCIPDRACSPDQQSLRLGLVVAAQSPDRLWRRPMLGKRGANISS